MKRLGKMILAAVLVPALAGILSGCSAKGRYGLDPENPTRIVVWDYYNGAQAVAFEEAVEKFNNTVGMEKGIVVIPESKGSIEDLNAAVRSAVNNEVGADPLPNVLQCYLDVAVGLDLDGYLANLDPYVTQEERKEYISSYIEEGVMGEGRHLKLFPLAKSTEILAVNKTEFDKFAGETGASYEDLDTWEGIARTAEEYFAWSGGKSFFGRDAFANYMILGSRQLGSEIFEVQDGAVTIHTDEAVMRKLWDNFYIPYIKGYFKHAGRYRSDDVKTGEIVACVCSTSGMPYFPQEVTYADGDIKPIEAVVLKPPHFEGADTVVAQQGAGMAVMKSNETEEYAATVFLKWFTKPDQNIGFSVSAGYLPVMTEANDLQVIRRYLEENRMEIPEIQMQTMQVAMEEILDSNLYITKGFYNGEHARQVLETSMRDLAVNDRETVLSQMEAGVSEDEALAPYLTDDYFERWMETLKARLEEICQ